MCGRVQRWLARQSLEEARQGERQRIWGKGAREMGHESRREQRTLGGWRGQAGTGSGAWEEGRRALGT